MFGMIVEFTGDIHVHKYDGEIYSNYVPVDYEVCHACLRKLFI